jgi:hypothetical protein
MTRARKYALHNNPVAQLGSLIGYNQRLTGIQFTERGDLKQSRSSVG